LHRSQSSEVQVDAFGKGSQGPDSGLLLGKVLEHVEREEPQRVLVGDLIDLVVGYAVEVQGKRLGGGLPLLGAPEENRHRHGECA
jgi:hypothetical protein